jgi:hypothetical protein
VDADDYAEDIPDLPEPWANAAWFLGVFLVAAAMILGGQSHGAPKLKPRPGPSPVVVGTEFTLPVSAFPQLEKPLRFRVVAILGDVCDVRWSDSIPADLEFRLYLRDGRHRIAVDADHNEALADGWRPTTADDVRGMIKRGE